MEKQRHALTTSPSNLASSLDDDYILNLDQLPPLGCGDRACQAYLWLALHAGNEVVVVHTAVGLGDEALEHLMDQEQNILWLEALGLCHNFYTATGGQREIGIQICNVTGESSKEEKEKLEFR